MAVKLVMVSYGDDVPFRRARRSVLPLAQAAMIGFGRWAGARDPAFMLTIQAKSWFCQKF
jgi:hypothetical protein